MRHAEYCYIYIFFAEYNTANYFETNLDSVDGSATPVLKNSQILGFGDSMEMSQSQDERNSSDWLSCVSKKTGMPRLILSLILLSCAVMMIWLCLTAAVTSPDHRIKQESKVWLQAQTVQYLSGLLHICSLISHWIQRCFISFIKKFSVKSTWKKLMQNWNAFFSIYFAEAKHKWWFRVSKRTRGYGSKTSISTGKAGCRPTPNQD